MKFAHDLFLCLLPVISVFVCCQSVIMNFAQDSTRHHCLPGNKEGTKSLDTGSASVKEDQDVSGFFNLSLVFPSIFMKNNMIKTK
jgi:hypothetical protein